MKKVEQVINEIKKRFKKNKEILLIILYGSVVRGEFSERHSDIDLFFVINKVNKDEKIESLIHKTLTLIEIKHKVRIHAEFQYLDIKEEDKTLIQKIVQEGQILINNGGIILSSEIIGLKPYTLVVFSTKNTLQKNRVKLSQALHGTKKWYYKGKRKIVKQYKGLIDNVNIYEAGKGALLVNNKMVKDIKLLFESLGVEFSVKKVVFG